MRMLGDVDRRRSCDSLTLATMHIENSPDAGSTKVNLLNLHRDPVLTNG